MAAGDARSATNDLARLVQAEDMGPLGCLTAARVLGRFDPRLAVSFARQGAAHATLAALQDDLRLLLRGEKAGQRFLQSTLQRAPLLPAQNLFPFTKFFGTNTLPILLEVLTVVKTNTTRPADEALRPVLDRHWEQRIRPELLTQFAEVCLAGAQGGAAPPEAAQASEAVTWVQDAADHGYARAQMLLGQLYSHGVGVSANGETAARWMRQALDQGYPHAACELGRLSVALGQRAEAIRWFRRGAQDGCSAAEVGLARALLSGSGGTPEEQEEAVAALRKAAARGSPEANLDLGNLDEQQGKIEDALKAYREAARKGATPAQIRLGDLLSDGISTKPDYVEAWMWLSLAAARGDRVAATAARSVEHKLSPEQRQDAQSRLQQMEETLSEGGH
jgi:TPR repeat protein